MQRQNLLEGDIPAHVRRLAFPLMWGMGIVTAASMIDALYISRLGTGALAALGFTIPVIMLSLGVLYGLSIGTTSVLSRAYGQGDMEKYQRLATDSIALTALIGVLCALLGYFFDGVVFKAMGAGEKTLLLAREYMAVWYVSMVFMGLVFIGNACVRSTGDTKFPSMTMVFVAVVQVLLAPVLMFGWLGAPAMGFTGSAATLLVAYVAVWGVSFYVLVFQRKILLPVFFHEGTIDAWKKIMHVAFPAMLSNLVAPLSTAIVTWMAASMGKEAVAALGVASRIEGVALVVFFSLATGVSILAGQNHGAGNHRRIVEAVGYGSRLSIVFGVIIALISALFSSDIAAWFDTSEKVISYTMLYLYAIPISYGAMGVAIISNAALNAIGRPVPAVSVQILRAFVFYVPFSYIGAQYDGFRGMMVALLASNFLTALIAYFWSRRIIL